MNKIKALLEKTGVAPELATKICESMEKYKTALREQFETDYAAKVEQAKRVCIEETEAHKRELSRRLQIFCETKGAAIETTLAKQSALSESEALTKLTSVAALVAGLEPNGVPNGNATAVIEKLKRERRVANEEKNKAVALANKKQAIAEKALKHNRVLANENAGFKKRGVKPVTEGRKAGKKSRRIDKKRKGGQPRSARPTLLENQERRAPAKSNQSHVSGTGNGNGYSVDGIAGGMDDDLI